MERLISSLSFEEIWRHFSLRIEAHQELTQDLATDRVQDYVDKALGIAAPHGNYSAAEHGLGPQILGNLNNNRIYERIFKFAWDINGITDPLQIPKFIEDANIHSLGISVGSEIAMMLKPHQNWVTNVRTNYADLLMKHSGDVNKANMELSLYRESMRDSEIDYGLWGSNYPKLKVSLTELARLGNKASVSQGLNSSNVTFLWADAIANSLYAKYSKLR
ncbi:MAG: hypothetical protein BZY87_04565 [SAR202 cluster bacterium Io17-Chloro-G6]|nr:MAG: hypothetical protein BZY87_04565 [SAR202 cluster bacterium Io17-Chloro-G6]